MMNAKFNGKSVTNTQWCARVKSLMYLLDNSKFFYTGFSWF